MCVSSFYIIYEHVFSKLHLPPRPRLHCPTLHGHVSTLAAAATEGASSVAQRGEGGKGEQQREAAAPEGGHARDRGGGSVSSSLSQNAWNGRNFDSDVMAVMAECQTILDKLKLMIGNLRTNRHGQRGHNPQPVAPLQCKHTRDDHGTCNAQVSLLW